MTRAKRQHYQSLPKSSKIAKARVEGLRVHFKNTSMTSRMIKGKSLRYAKQYLHNVLKHRDVVVFPKYNGGPGRNSAAKKHGFSQGRYPVKPVYAFLNLLKNAENNARSQGLNVRKLYIAHVFVNRAAKIRRRTFRAHGRINPYMSSPSHIEVVLAERQGRVSAPKDQQQQQPMAVTEE